MTSVMRSFPQIPARIKYFIILDDISENPATFTTSFTYNSAIVLPSLPPPIISETDFVSAYSDPSGVLIPRIQIGQQLKDLGQQFTITDSNFKHRAVYRRVQQVHGLSSEGVSGYPGGMYYVKVWDSLAPPTQPVLVVRTG